MECYRKIGERQTRASPLLSWTKIKNGGNIYIIYFLPKPGFIHENFHTQSYKKPQRHLDWMTCWIEWLVIRVFYCRFQFTEISYSKHQFSLIIYCLPPHNGFGPLRSFMFLSPFSGVSPPLSRFAPGQRREPVLRPPFRFMMGSSKFLCWSRDFYDISISSAWMIHFL